MKLMGYWTGFHIGFVNGELLMGTMKEVNGSLGSGF